MPLTPTVSMWPQSISDGPGCFPSSVATTLGRPGAASAISTVRPAARHSSAIRRAISSSPRAPGTSDGLTESMATRSASRAIVVSFTARHNRSTITDVMSLDLARRIARATHDAGGRALIVGGWVRDRLRDQPSKDIDLEVFGIQEDRLAGMLAEFGRVEAVGQSFAVYKVIGTNGAGAIDVALPRRESKSGRGHKGFR